MRGTRSRWPRPPTPGQQVVLTGHERLEHLLDVHQYVDDFNDAVIGAYAANATDESLAADVGVARSIIPPGTSAVRDFSHLAPQIPELIADRCVGCMTCVNACPDSAILGVALPISQVDSLVSSFAASLPMPAIAEATARSHFAHTTKYADVPAKKGLEPAEFGIFVDPVHCKGCAECVDLRGEPQRRRRETRMSHVRSLRCEETFPGRRRV